MEICPVHWGDGYSTAGDNISTVEGYLQYCGGITAVHVGDTLNTVEVVQYSGG